MEKHNVITLILIIFLLLISSGAFAGDEFDNAEAIIKEHCKNQWPKDFFMSNACQEQQIKAWRKLQQDSPKDIPIGDFQIIKEHCCDQWPKDFFMRNACQEQQIKAWRKLQQDSPKDIPIGDFQIIKEHCCDQWPKDFFMRNACEEQQIKAWRKLNK